MNTNPNLNLTASPHIRSNNTTKGIMLDVIIALLPTTVFGVFMFKLQAALIIVVTVLSCILSETVFNMVMHKKNTIGDLSCIVTGLILALNMPPTVDLYIPVIGGIFAIVVAKMLFGGLGQNFINPALAGRCFLLISFTSQMSKYVDIDGFTTATPLALAKQSVFSYSLADMFIGTIPGTIGEVSTLALLLGAIYLLIKKVITIDIPLVYILSFTIFILLFGGNNSTDFRYIYTEVLGGGLMFGAFFMANDYVTSPVTSFGRVIYAIFLGVLTGLFRVFGKFPEGVSYAILTGNLLVPLIESITIPRPFGKEGK